MHRAILRCVGPTRAVIGSRVALATYSTDYASQILNSSLEDAKKTSVTYIHKKYLEELPKAGPVDESKIDEALKVFSKVLELRSIDQFSCARLTLLCLNNNLKERVFEPWTRLIEALGADNFRRKINQSDFDAPALSVLAAYFVVAGPEADVQAALRLVPKKSFPSNFFYLKNLGGIQSEENNSIALRGLSRIVSHTTNKFTSPEFLEQVAKSSFGEVNSRWTQVNTALKPEEIAEVCYAAFIRQFAMTKQVNRAFDTWQQLVSSNPNAITSVSWSALLHAGTYSPKKSLDIVAELWEKMVTGGFKPTAECYTERVLCFVRNGKMEQALKLFKEMQELNVVELAAVNVITTSLARQKRFEEVDEVLEWTNKNNIQTSSYTFNPILEEASKVEDKNIARKYFQMMFDNKVEPDIVTYTVALNRTIKLGLPTDDLLAEMKKAKIMPNVEFETALAFSKDSRAHTVENSRKTMEKWKRERTKPNLVSLTAFIDLELMYGEVDRAVSYSALISKYGLVPSVPLLNLLIRGGLSRQRYDVALSAFSTLVKGRHIRAAANTFTFMHILSGWSLNDIQSNKELQELVKTALPYLETRENLVDYPMAKRIVEIHNLLGSEVVPDTINAIANERLMGLYNRHYAQ